MSAVTVTRGAIEASLRALPGAAVLLPLAAGIALGAAAPHVRTAFASAELSRDGGMAAVVLMLFCVGVQLDPHALAPVGRRVMVLVAAAGVLGVLAVGYGWWFGAAGVAGVSLLAVATVAPGMSPALWVVLSGRYGTQADQSAGAVAITLTAGPPATLLLLTGWGVLAGDGRTGLPWAGLVDALAPLVAGFGFGLLLPAVRASARQVVPWAMGAFSFSLGAQLPVRDLAHHAVGGLVLGVVVAVAAGAVTAAGWRLLLGQPATVGWAAAARTVGAPIVPGIAAALIPSWAPYAAAATVQVSIAVIVSTALAPVLTAWAHHRRRHHGGRLIRLRRPETAAGAAADARPGQLVQGGGTPR